MPELPEVETVCRQLHARLAGRTITDILLYRSGREQPAGAFFASSLKGKTIENVERRAKLLIWKFDDGSAMTAHLKMTGRFIFVDDPYEPTKHDRILFQFDGTHVVWNDVRQFGFVRVVTSDELENTLSAYGPEPLETSADALAQRVATPKTRSIKAALLNQEVIAGVGNIYADEVCFRAGVRPTRSLGTLGAHDRARLMSHLKELLSEAVAQRGTSANDYVDTEGKQGGFLNLLRVYGREGEPCVTCKTPIKKIVHVQRGTHYCPECQK